MKRNRWRATNSPPGTYTYTNQWGPVVLSSVAGLLQESVTDYKLPGNGHKFYVERFGISDHSGPILISGSTAGSVPNVASNYPVARINAFDTWLKQHALIGGQPSLMSAATELVAKTNPSRPHVDIPVFIRELRELPALFAKRTSDLSRDISSKRLSNEFGWKPLVGDLLKFLDFVKAFEDRFIELEKLHETGLRRKRKLFSGSSPTSTVYSGSLDNNRGLWVDGRVTNVTTTEIWGFCRWTPDKESLDYKVGLFDVDNSALALMAVLGITPTIVDLSSIWELIPFSWLADWCSNAGDYLAAHRNIVGAKVDKIQIMQRTYTQSVCSITKVAPGFNTSRNECVRYRENLSREPVSALAVEAHFPFLNERKIAILADVVNGVFRRSKIDHRRGATTSWNFQPTGNR